jgi:aflatoxin B1 aldehyde reductase
MPSPKLIFGAGGIGEGSISHTWTTPEQTNELLQALEELELRQLDSAASYPPGSPWAAETLLGQANAAKKGFVIDTKILAFPLRGPDPKAKLFAESLTEENIHGSFQKSLELLGVEKVNILYPHCPDPVTPIEESAKALNEEFKAGHFEKVCLISSLNSNETDSEI